MLYTTSPNDLKNSFNVGNIFSYPTEAVYGIGCNPDNESAVHQLLKIKNRSMKKGLILIAADFSQVQKYLKPLSLSQKKLTHPSETTYLYPALDSAPKWLTGKFNTLAVRITKHPLAHELCLTLNSAIVSTSANLSGHPPAKTAKQVYAQLGDKLGIILEGEVGDLLTPTVIRDSISGRIIRS